MSSSPLPIFTCKSSECSFGEMSTAFLGLSSILVIKSDTSRRSCHLNGKTPCTLDPWWAVSWASDCFCNLANSSAAGFPPEKSTQKNMARMNRHQDVSGVFSKAANWIHRAEMSRYESLVVVFWRKSRQFYHFSHRMYDLKSTQMNLQLLKILCWNLQKLGTKNSMAKLSSFMGINEGAHNTSQHLTRKFT